MNAYTAYLTQFMMKNILIIVPKLAGTLSRLLANKFAQTIAGSWLIAAGAQISIPFYPVQMTLQTFAIALISLVMPVELAIGSVLFYISYAAMGIPVLAGGGTGIIVLLGPRAGYIVGFLAMSAIIGLLMKLYPTSGVLKRLLFTFLGASILFLLGTSHLAHLFNWNIAIKTGLLPFIFSEPVKLTLAAYLSVFVQDKYVNK
jgi:biotin transport system substrate-specific component